PVRNQRLTRPPGARFVEVLTHREDEIHVRSVGLRELHPALGAERSRLEIQLLEDDQGLWVNLFLRMRPGREGLEFPHAFAAEDGFRYDRPGRVALIEKEYAVEPIDHRRSLETRVERGSRVRELDCRRVTARFAHDDIS